jgi:hypothetical protein
MPLNSVEKSVKTLDIHTVLPHALPAANAHMGQHAPAAVEAHQCKALPRSLFPDLGGIETDGTAVGEVGGNLSDQCRFADTGQPRD